MKLRTSNLAVVATLVAALLLANCSSDNPSGSANTAGAPAAGASPGGSAGKAGSAAAGASAAGAAAGGAGGGSGGAHVAGGGAGGGAAGGAGNAAGAGGAPALEASFNTVKAVIQMSCFGAGCHGEPGNPLQMKIDDQLYGTLMDHTTKNCGKLINTASPADSAFIKLMLGDCGTPPNVTSRMPFGSCFQGDVPGPDAPTCVLPEKVAAIQAWITKGAPQQ